MMERPTSKQPVFLLHQIGNDHSEGIAVMEMNGDGILDVISGAYWYEAPDWQRHKFREVKIEGEYVVNCGEFTIDADEDGDLDIVGGGWQEDGIFWWENPGELGPIWEKHLITTSPATEGMWRADIDGDGKDEMVAVHYREMEVFYISFAGGKPAKHRVGGKEGDGHGIGLIVLPDQLAGRKLGRRADRDLEGDLLLPRASRSVNEAEAPATQQTLDGEVGDRVATLQWLEALPHAIPPYVLWPEAERPW